MAYKSIVLLLVALSIIGGIANTTASATPLRPHVNSTATSTLAPLSNNIQGIADPRRPGVNATATLSASSPRRRGNATESWSVVRQGCLYNESTGRCLDIEQSRKSPQSADAQMWRCNNNPAAQSYDIVQYTGGGSTTIERGRATTARHATLAIIRASRSSFGNHYCLDVPGGDAFEGQLVRWWKCNESQAQKWTINSETVDMRGHISPYGRPDLCLDPRGGMSNQFDQPLG
ncbi:hypothetical protein BCR44DRAFT_39888 [Catenaria anguillulae PL171]|uniref:Ricin B lectin domain-containing protein n=1 Tax=Catenaria anguillulae PL171 TaxID=765915 RepID=A0A1Y2H5Z3_9FUNG|nr:hypothetical protein BCR44DRAFT_39888 [Catenaria anguillulae PL171]